VDERGFVERDRPDVVRTGRVDPRIALAKADVEASVAERRTTVGVRPEKNALPLVETPSPRHKLPVSMGF
jgi:hypothetical protein